MNYRKISILLSYLMQALMVFYVFLAFYRREYSEALIGIVVLAITFSPLIIRRKWNLTLPWVLNFLIVLTLFMHSGGVILGSFKTIAPYDKISHFIGSSTAAIIGLTLLVIMDRFSKIRISRKYAVFFIIIFTMAIGAFWEILEFLSDLIFKTNSQPGLTDTMVDLIVDFFAGVLVAFIVNTDYSVKKRKILCQLEQNC